MKNLILSGFLLITSGVFAQTELLSEKITTLKKYDRDHLLRVALPIGGIGNGTVSSGGSGKLRDWEVMNVPAWPRDFNIDPSGKYLLAVGERSDEILLYKIDHETGKLTTTAAKIKLPAPGCILYIY